MLPVRITIMSYNLWNVVRWKEREPALGKFLTRFSPDILCTQEISDEAIDCISENLESHGHVMDELPGWHCESNIFWNREYFSEVGHGLEKMETVSYTHLTLPTKRIV